jgi:exocyst complex protein 7
MPAIPNSVLITLRQVVSFLRTLPLPSTHPSHPAAPEILGTLKDTQKGYADMRGAWAQKCLETQGRRVVDRADTIDGVVAGKEFGRWVEMALSVADVGFSSLFSLI